MSNILEEAINVKLLRERRRFERETVNHAQYRAICHDCDWTWQSAEDRENPDHARTRARAHTETAHHSTETLFDIYAQHDMAFVSRMREGR